MDLTFRVVAPNGIIKLNDSVAIIKISRRNGRVIDFLIDSDSSHRLNVGTII